MMSKNAVNFFRGSWIADYGDAENYLAVFYSKHKVPDGPNYTGYFNKDYDKFLKAVIMKSIHGKS